MRDVPTARRDQNRVLQGVFGLGLLREKALFLGLVAFDLLVQPLDAVFELLLSRDFGRKRLLVLELDLVQLDFRDGPVFFQLGELFQIFVHGLKLGDGRVHRLLKHRDGAVFIRGFGVQSGLNLAQTRFYRLQRVQEVTLIQPSQFRAFFDHFADFGRHGNQGARDPEGKLDRFAFFCNGGKGLRPKFFLEPGFAKLNERDPDRFALSDLRLSGLLLLTSAGTEKKKKADENQEAETRPFTGVIAFEHCKSLVLGKH